MLKGKTMADSIYEALREEVIELKLQPGAKLSETQLAERYSVSRAPIRDAIRKLQQDKLVIVRPQIGTIVAPISLEKADEICEVRVLLEPFAAGVAAERFGEDEEARLGKAFEELTEAAEDEEAHLLYETDRLLHETIWTLCGNREIAHIMEGYRDEIGRIRRATAQLANRIKPSAKEMRVIYDALVRRDPRAARSAMEVHIGNVRSAVRSVLEEEKTSDPITAAAAEATDA